mmetsp:Transcript_22496/g.72731  ORF Transcript_22496/g.72731 Transcript_22496/m.72731 type:complete len:275 (+) Transcript_22496:534-1358(+)
MRNESVRAWPKAALLTKVARGGRRLAAVRGLWRVGGRTRALGYRLAEELVVWEALDRRAESPVSAGRLGPIPRVVRLDGVLHRAWARLHPHGAHRPSWPSRRGLAVESLGGRGEDGIGALLVPRRLCRRGVVGAHSRRRVHPGAGEATRGGAKGSVAAVGLAVDLGGEGVLVILIVRTRPRLPHLLQLLEAHRRRAECRGYTVLCGGVVPRPVTKEGRRSVLSWSGRVVVCWWFGRSLGGRAKHLTRPSHHRRANPARHVVLAWARPDLLRVHF